MLKIESHDAFKEKVLKKTKHRTAILEILKKSEQPLPAEKIYFDMINNETKISLSTVYRALESLIQNNLVTKINLSGDSKALFEYKEIGHRHYLVCLCCKKIFPIDFCPLEEYEKKLAKENNFLACGHKLDIYGYCYECQKKMESNI